jgi:hypothetical protein
MQSQLTPQFDVSIFNQNGSMVRNYLIEGYMQLNISGLKPAAYQIIITNKENGKQNRYKLFKINN